MLVQALLQQLSIVTCDGLIENIHVACAGSAPAAAATSADAPASAARWRAAAAGPRVRTLLAAPLQARRDDWHEYQDQDYVTYDDEEDWEASVSRRAGGYCCCQLWW